MKIERLTHIEQPWVLKLIGHFDKLIDHLHQYFDKDNVFILDGFKMKTFDDMYDEFSNILRLPDYFGRNLNALDECLNDLEWLNIDKVLIVIINSDLILCNEHNVGCGLLIELLDNAGAEWSKPIENNDNWDRLPFPFHAIFQTNKEGIKEIDRLPELEI